MKEKGRKILPEFTSESSLKIWSPLLLERSISSPLSPTKVQRG